MRVFNCLNFFRKPSEERLKGMLRDLGITKDDKRFGILKADLKKLILRKSNEEKFAMFFSDYSIEIYEKLTQELNQRDTNLSKKIDEIKEVKAELEYERNRNLSTFVTEVFSRNVFGFVDEPSFMILKYLRDGCMDTKSIQKKIKLSHGEFFWRMDYLKRLGLVTTTYTSNQTIYQLSNTFQRIFSMKYSYFEHKINSQKNIVEELSFKAVGGNKQGAKRLLSWVNSDRYKRHKDILRKIVKKHPDPIKASQVFFGMREKGTTHEKHIGVKIKDHRSSGELLSLGIS